MKKESGCQPSPAIEVHECDISDSMQESRAIYFMQILLEAAFSFNLPYQSKSSLISKFVNKSFVQSFPGFFLFYMVW
jgi:hypothetical protein